MSKTAMGLRHSILSVCIFCAVAAAQPKSGPHPPSRGDPLVTVGKTMTYGGLALTFFGFSQWRVLAGMAAFNLGVPLTGAGAALVNKEAKAVDSGYHPRPRGWGWNLTGTALVAAGIADASRGPHGSPDAVITLGGVLIEAGMICDLVAMAKFTNYAGEGRAILAAHKGIALEPSWLGRQGRAEPGLRMTYRF